MNLPVSHQVVIFSLKYCFMRYVLFSFFKILIFTTDFFLGLTVTKQTPHISGLFFKQIRCPQGKACSRNDFKLLSSFFNENSVG